jgi:hypothetical protein
MACGVSVYYIIIRSIRLNSRCRSRRYCRTSTWTPSSLC